MENGELFILKPYVKQEVIFNLPSIWLHILLYLVLGALDITHLLSHSHVV